MKSLTEIDTVPWAALTHAYGSADDIPALLRRLAEPESAPGEGVWSDFYGRLCHQGGTFYTASIEVVPFLTGFLADADFAGDRRFVIMALVDLAGAEGSPQEIESSMSDALSAAVTALEPIATDPLTRLGLLCVDALTHPRANDPSHLDNEDGASLGPLAREIATVAHELRRGRAAPQAVILRRLLPLRAAIPDLLDGYVDDADWRDPDAFPHRQERWDREMDERLAAMGSTSARAPHRVPPSHQRGRGRSQAPRRSLRGLAPRHGSSRVSRRSCPTSS